mmetsp:Transcript_59707/g.185167  ORF Transcript_59707/g.185167 Transcript_59707/m.185167 type:complete len:313 (+) Transcript_59707:63-1001(+)
MATSYSRPRLRSSGGRSKWNIICACAALGAIALAQTISCSAFTPSFSTAVSPTAQGRVPLLQQQVAAPVGVHPKANSIASGAPWHVIGCAALVLAASAARGTQSGKTRKPRHAVTACRAAPVFMSAPARQPTAPTEPIMTAPSRGCYEAPLIEMATVAAPAVPCIRAPQVEALRAAPAGPATEAAPQAAPQAASVHRRPSAGRFAGGARRTSARTGAGRRAGAAARTARRSMGARLQGSRPVIEVPPVPFDASRLEMRIQMGLRTQSCMWSARRREAKTPSSSKASSERTGLYLMSIHFENRFHGALHQLDR